MHCIQAASENCRPKMAAVLTYLRSLNGASMCWGPILHWDQLDCWQWWHLRSPASVVLAWSLGCQTHLLWLCASIIGDKVKPCLCILALWYPVVSKWNLSMLWASQKMIIFTLSWSSSWLSEFSQVLDGLRANISQQVQGSQDIFIRFLTFLPHRHTHSAMRFLTLQTWQKLH